MSTTIKRSMIYQTLLVLTGVLVGLTNWKSAALTLIMVAGCFEALTFAALRIKSKSIERLS